MTVDTNPLGGEWMLLAKDGVYVAGAPPAHHCVHDTRHRADIVVRCTSAGGFALTGAAATPADGPTHAAPR